MTCRLDVEGLIEVIVDVDDQVALEDLRQFEDLFVDCAIDPFEVLVDDFLADLELVLEVLEQLIVHRVDGRQILRGFVVCFCSRWNPKTHPKHP